MKKRQLSFLALSLPLMLLSCSPDEAAPEPTSGTASRTAAAQAPSPTDLPSPSSAPQYAGAGRIAFASDRDGSMDIFVMTFDGAPPVNLTNSESYDYAPVWSPDGSRIAYVSAQVTKEGLHTYIDSSNIHVLDLDDGSVVNVSADTANNSSPTWSPDGQRIAYMSTFGENDGIYVVDADGGRRTRLTFAGDIITRADGSGYRREDRSPSWSPAGDAIAYISNQGDSQIEVFVLDPDGGEPLNLSAVLTGAAGGGASGAGPGLTPQFDVPVWSPDGKQVAVVSDALGDMGGWDIFTIEAGGAGFTQHSDGSTAQPFALSWSPDGSSLLYIGLSENGFDLFSLDTASGTLSQLTHIGVWPSGIAWSPDGKSVAFVVAQPDEYGIPASSDIYVIEVESGQVSNLTQSAALDGGPAWAP